MLSAMGHTPAHCTSIHPEAGTIRWSEQEPSGEAYFGDETDLARMSVLFDGARRTESSLAAQARSAILGRPRRACAAARFEALKAAPCRGSTERDS